MIGQKNFRVAEIHTHASECGIAAIRSPLGEAGRNGRNGRRAQMKYFKDIHNRRVRLTDERQKHIEIDHPEMFGQVNKIDETLSNPDTIVRSRTDPDIELFYRHYEVTPVTDKYLCVVVKILVGDRFIVTAYFTDTIKRGETLWRKR